MPDKSTPEGLRLRGVYPVAQAAYERYLEEHEQFRALPYRVLDLDLGVARAEERIYFKGNAIDVVYMSAGGAEFSIRIDKRQADPIPFLAIVGVRHHYNELWLTNAAQPGMRAVLILSVDLYA